MRWTTGIFTLSAIKRLSGVGQFSIQSSKMSLVTFKSANKLGECPGFYVSEGNSTKGLIVLQEWWGMNEQIKSQAQDIAKQGNFQAIVPDLYRGKVTTDNEEAGHFMGNLDWEGAVKDIQGAANFLKSKGCAKVGVTGFCMGGALSIAAAAMLTEIDAAAPFYGIPKADLCDPANIKCPLQLHFGEKDQLVGFASPEDYQALAEKLKSAGVKFELYTYPAGHAFMNKTSPLQTYTEELYKLASTRLIDFMNKELA